MIYDDTEYGKDDAFHEVRNMISILNMKVS